MEKEDAKVLQEVLCKIENIRFLMKDAKYIVAYEHLLGVQQKLSHVYGAITGQVKSENNPDG